MEPVLHQSEGVEYVSIVRLEPCPSSDRYFSSGECLIASRLLQTSDRQQEALCKSFMPCLQTRPDDKSDPADFATTSSTSSENNKTG
jgi:hypothetical protein